MNDYLNSDEFKEIFERYVSSKKRGTISYFDAEEYVDIADNLLLSGKPDEAMQAVDEGLRLHPDDDELYCTKSAINIYNRRFAEASRVLNMVKDKSDSNVVYQMAQLAYALDLDTQRAEEIFAEWVTDEEKSICKSHDEDSESRLRDAYIHIITSFIDLVDDYDVELIRRWVEEYYARFAPLGSSECDLILADIVRSEGIADMTEKLFTSLLESDPYLRHGWTVVAMSQVVNGKFAEALTSVDFSLAIDPDDLEAILTKAHALYSLGNYVEALPHFEHYFSESDDESQYLPYVISLLQTDQPSRAKEYLLKAEAYVRECELQTEFYAQANYDMSEVWLVLNDYDQALMCINQALRKYPNDPTYLFQRGAIHLARHEMMDCFDSFRSCVEYTNDKFLTTLDIAHRFMLAGETEIAHKLLDTATKTENHSPRSSLVEAYRALTYFVSGDTELFLHHLQLACATCPDMVGRLFSEIMPQNLNPRDFYEFLVKNKE